jgi:hypothetical protein
VKREIVPAPSPAEEAAIEAALRALETEPEQFAGRSAWWRAGVDESVDQDTESATLQA